MWLNRLFRRRKDKDQEKEAEKQKQREADKNPSIGQGIYYLYMIVLVQVFFVFGIVSVIFFVGKVIATPLWVFIAMFLVTAGGIYYIWQKAKLQMQKLREAMHKVNLSDRNYSISIMNGLLTMRVEHDPSRMLQAPDRNRPALEDPNSKDSSGKPILDAEIVDPPSS